MRENGLMFRTFAQFLFKMNFSRGAGVVQNAFGNSGGVGFIFILKNGNSKEVVGSYLKLLCGRGMDIFWNHTF